MTVVKSELLKRILKRRSFAGLMDLYEINYGLLSRLVPCLDAIDATAMSRVSESPDLYLTVEERCPFTTTLRLTYYFAGPDGSRIADPDLQVRLYHDARQAEAVACRHRGFMPLQTSTGAALTALECKWDSNLFLEKWLRYALSQGHGFHGSRDDGGLLPPRLEPSLTAS